MLACTGKIRRVLLDEHGAVLHLGRSHRLASPAQKAALLARDVGCVIPGCTTPGDLCQIHHVTAWTDHGDTDIHNLALLRLSHEPQDAPGCCRGGAGGVVWVGAGLAGAVRPGLPAGA
jgi:hypothetical protein